MSDMSIKVIYHVMSLTTVPVSPRWVICLSQWFIMLYLWLYCTSITKMSDMSITVIYHVMSMTVLYQYHQDEWYVYQSHVSAMSMTVHGKYRERTSLYYSHHEEKIISSLMTIHWCFILSASAMSMTVLYVYHSDLSAMSMTVLYVYHSDLSAMDLEISFVLLNIFH
jgi:hypothetical protein